MRLRLEERRRGATIIFSTHVLTQAEELCDHLFMINNGHKVLDGSLHSIRERTGLQIIGLEPMDDGADIQVAASLPMVAQAEKVGREWRLTLTEDTDPHQAMQALVAAHQPLRVEMYRPSLEDIFIEMVEAGARDVAERSLLRAALRVEGTGAAGGEAP